MRVWGWAFDPDATASARTVRVTVDGGHATTLTANQSRPDVATGVPSAGSRHGWSTTLTLPEGTHTRVRDAPTTSATAATSRCRARPAA